MIQANQGVGKQPPPPDCTAFYTHDDHPLDVISPLHSVSHHPCFVESLGCSSPVPVLREPSTAEHNNTAVNDQSPNIDADGDALQKRRKMETVTFNEPPNVERSFSATSGMLGAGSTQLLCSGGGNKPQLDYAVGPFGRRS